MSSLYLMDIISPLNKCGWLWQEFQHLPWVSLQSAQWNVAALNTVYIRLCDFKNVVINYNVNMDIKGSFTGVQNNTTWGSHW